MKSNYVDRARKFIKAIYPFLEENRYDFYKVNRAVKAFNKEKLRNVKFCNGAARFALLTSDYVIKWDRSVAATRRYGGCKKEEERWRDFSQTKFSSLFVPVFKIKECGCTWYVMPRITGQAPRCIAYHYLTLEEQRFFMDKHITDVHCGNFVLKRGRPLIFDYAG